jgi:putative drug exporter of the RND superfamily
LTHTTFWRGEYERNASLRAEFVLVLALLSFASPPTTRGETLGLAQAVAGLGRVIGPLAAGSILATLGPGAPFFVGSALVVLAALIAFFVLNITTLFGLGLGVDYSLFMVSRFREELAHGRSVDDAVTISVATAGRAVTFSGLTVSIGLLGLTFFHINMLHSVGLGGILVVFLAVLAAITLLPAALAIIGTRINAFPVRIPNVRKRVGTLPGGRYPDSS